MNNETQEPIEKKIPMVVLMTQLKTRAQRRRAKREAAIIIKALLPVETLFNNAILAEATEKAEEVSYEQLYTIFLDMWELRLRSLQVKDLRLARPNVRYFADSYAPKIAVNE